ncbi:MAG TPA: adenylate/guanylate cyclase domain-containing protein, partial [Chloroflexia bacterium]|nr:adenylate/guanylate cyclase domain-containing protein [Chloroflexia bacterium]
MIDRFFRRAPGIDEGVARLARYDYPAPVLTGFTAYLQRTPSEQLDHLQPGDVALALGLDEHATLELLVAAVHEGVCNLYWTAHCAHCDGQTQEWAHLNQARAATYCPMCQVASDTELDRTLKVRFALSPRYRGPRRRGRGAPAPAEPVMMLTGLDMLNMQVFRDLLQQEVLAVDESLLVTRVALLFSDLRGSTALYARRGDPVAYRLVRDHYELIRRQVRAARGAVVKTVGDGVMATFPDAAAALRAGLAMQEDLTRFNRERRLMGDDALLLKLGVHTGSCLSVNLNGRMDYFGTAVNIASRVEGLAQGADLVATGAVLGEPAAREVIAAAQARGATLQEFTAELRGIAEPVPVTRMTLP